MLTEIFLIILWLALTFKLYQLVLYIICILAPQTPKYIDSLSPFRRLLVENIFLFTLFGCSAWVWHSTAGLSPNNPYYDICELIKCLLEED